MKKGQVLWTSIALIPALLIVTWSIIMLQSEIDNYIEMSARYQSLELSGIINILQASPEETTHAYKPPYCAEIYTSDERDYVRIRDFVATVELIKTPIDIEPGTIGCEEGEESIVRKDRIRIERG